ncbi:MAG: CocE/NonD family hydrolase [Actinomycetota bacterium]|nr:CocE/NonD family hydrolase [Actinomycetota bacterium]
MIPPLLRARALLLALGVLLGLFAVPSSQAATVQTIRQTADLTMADGTTLRYTVVRPKNGRKLPTLFEYSGYDPGTNPDATYIRQYVESGAGYNYIGVSLRGTGCSSGTFDFFQPAEAKDGAAVIAWIRKQGWSDGKVGMIGKSYPGITQLFVAAENPPGLLAIAPGHFFSDAYRDVARPGGIQNYGFASLWSFVGRPSYEFQSSPGRVARGDARCLNGVTAETRGLPTNPFVQLQEHPYDDALYKERSPAPRLSRITSSVLATESWQDEQLASRGTDLIALLDDLNAKRRGRKTQWWLDVTNGDHGMMRTTTGYADLRRYYDYTLKGIDNGWSKRPRVQVWWDSKVDGRKPTWISGMQHWSEKQRVQAGILRPYPLTLHGNGALSTAKPGPMEAARSYAYTPGVGSQGIGNPAYGGVAGAPNTYLWSQKPPPNTSLAWTTAPVRQDLTLLGSASLDLWISSTAPDTDLQVTLSEVRPDGKEMYLQKGWLKIAQRKLDPARSTPLRPYQTHTQQDVQFLTPGTAVPARVEVFPFAALIRKGSSLRVSIEAPTVLPELWAFTPFPTPALNTVLSDAAHPSRLVLPMGPNDANRSIALPACDTLIREPCR